MKRYDTSSHMADTHAMLNAVVRERDWLNKQKTLLNAIREPVIMCDVCKETGEITVQAILFPSNDN